LFREMKVARNKGRDTELKDIVQWLKLRRNRDAGRSWEEDSPRTPKDKTTDSNNSIIIEVSALISF
jgi:hypothetical protein